MPESDRSDRVVVCLVTTPTSRAGDIARSMVESELAACVNTVASVRSTYRWDGAVEEGEESLLIVKTTRDAVPALDDLLGRVHPYDTYELVAVPVDGGSAPYLAWISASVSLST